jgi:hypothetical protein
MCLAECCETIGADLHVGGPIETWAATMFGEQPSRVVISIAAKDEKSVVSAAQAANIEVSRLGVVAKGPLRIGGTVPCEVPIDAILEAREGCLDAIVVA